MSRELTDLELEALEAAARDGNLVSKGRYFDSTEILTREQEAELRIRLAKLEEDLILGKIGVSRSKLYDKVNKIIMRTFKE